MNYLYSYRNGNSKFSGFESLKNYQEPIKFNVQKDHKNNFFVMSCDLKRPSNSLLKFVEFKAGKNDNSNFITRFPVIGDRVYKIEIFKSV